MAKEFFKFILAGVSNTLIGMLLIFFFYNKLALGYWASTALGYLAGGVWAYFMSRYFVFRYQKKEKWLIIRFALNMAVCYFMAYLIAKPATVRICHYAMPQLSKRMTEKTAIVMGMGIYTLLNFLGQRFICFRTSVQEQTHDRTDA